MKGWNLIVDISKCHDCNNCFLACKDEFCGNDFAPYSAAQPEHGHRWMNIMRNERGQYPLVDVSYLPQPCMQCDDAPCIAEAEGGGIHKRDDGIVVIDPVKSEGHKELVDKCPYGAIWWNEEKNIPQKCTFCVHLLEDGWVEPRCVQACPTGALKVVRAENSEMKEIVKSEDLKAYRPELNTAPRVYYKHLYRYTCSLITGSVVFEDTDECAENAKITVIDCYGKIVGSAFADNYGDFRVDGLDAAKGAYRVEIEFNGYVKNVVETGPYDRMGLGTLFLRPL